MKSFAPAPAVIAALADDINFLPAILSDVRGPEFAGFAIEAHAPHIAETVSIDFRTHRSGLEQIRGRDRGVADERIVGRNSIRQIRAALVDVDANNFCQQRVKVLTVIARIAGRATVAE